MDREQYLDAEYTDGESPAANLAGQVESPIDAALIADEMQALLVGLGEQECAMLDLKLQQFTNDEIANQLSCSERTVRRVMKRFQERWLESESED